MFEDSVQHLWKVDFFRTRGEMHLRKKYQTLKQATGQNRTLIWLPLIHYVRPGIFSIRAKPHGLGSLSYPNIPPIHHLLFRPSIALRVTCHSTESENRWGFINTIDY